jgi:hypothetical protein
MPVAVTDWSCAAGARGRLARQGPLITMGQAAGRPATYPTYTRRARCEVLNTYWRHPRDPRGLGCIVCRNAHLGMRPFGKNGEEPGSVFDDLPGVLGAQVTGGAASRPRRSDEPGCRSLHAIISPKTSGSASRRVPLVPSFGTRPITLEMTCPKLGQTSGDRDSGLAGCSTRAGVRDAQTPVGSGSYKSVSGIRARRTNPTIWHSERRDLHILRAH